MPRSQRLRQKSDGPHINSGERGGDERVQKGFSNNNTDIHKPMLKDRIANGQDIDGNGIDTIRNNINAINHKERSRASRKTYSSAYENIFDLVSQVVVRMAHPIEHEPMGVDDKNKEIARE